MSKTQFQNFCSNFMENLYLGVYDEKSSVIQALENISIDSNCLYSHKRLFSVTLCVKNGCVRSHPDIF